MASALLYSTSYQISWLGASYVSVPRRACIWVYKQANFSQIGQYHRSSCIDNSSSSPVFTSPLPAALVLASLRRSCFSWRSHVQLTKSLRWRTHAQLTACLPWRFHAQSTKVCPGGSMPSWLSLPWRFHAQLTKLPWRFPVDLSLPWRTHAQSTKVFLVHHSRTNELSCTTHIKLCTIVHYSHTPLSCTTHVISSTTLVHHSHNLMHYSHALFSCTTLVISFTTLMHHSRTLVHCHAPLL